VRRNQGIPLPQPEFGQGCSRLDFGIDNLLRLILDTKNPLPGSGHDTLLRHEHQPKSIGLLLHGLGLNRQLAPGGWLAEMSVGVPAQLVGQEEAVLLLVPGDAIECPCEDADSGQQACHDRLDSALAVHK
jgi:hypothetical protein